MRENGPRRRAAVEDWLRRALAWALPALLLAGIATAAVGVAGRTGPVDPTSGLFPREPGATWTYANRTDGTPTGHDVVQVVETAHLSEQVVDVMETRWDDFLGRGVALVSRRYVSTAGPQVLDHGSRSRSTETFSAIDPPMPIVSVDGSSSWEGTVNGEPGTAELEDLGREELEVAGRAYRSCLHQRQRVAVTGDTGYTSTLETWSCPDVGIVKSAEVYVQGETTIRLERDLVAFSTRDLSFRTAEAPAAGAARAEPAGAGTTTDLGAGRTNAIAGTLDVSSYAWTDRMLARPVFPPLATGGARMLVVDDEGVLTSTDVRSGEVAWRVRVRPPVPVAPVVADGLVLVADGAKGLLALDAETGTTRWSSAFPDVPSTSPVVVDGVLAVAFEDRTLRGVAVADGRTVWERDTTGRVVQPLASDGGLVHVADTDGLLVALSPEDGGSAWELDLGATPTGGPAVVEGLLVVADDQGFVLALDADDGDVRWQEYRERTVSEQLAVTPEAVALVLDGVELEVLDAASGTSRWTARTDEVDVAPVVVGGALAVVDEGGAVSTYELGTGRRTARRELGADPGDVVVGSVAMGAVDDTLVVPVSHRLIGGGALFAFPIAAERARDGVRLSRRLQRLPAPPLVPPSGTIDDFVYPAAGGAVWRVTRGSTGEPLAEDTSSFFAIATGDRVLFRGDEGLHVAAADTGELLWTAPMAAPSPGVAPTVVGDTVVVPVQGSALTAYGPDGALRWAQEVPDAGAANASTPLALPDGDVLYAGGALARYDGETGAQVWSAGELEVFAPLAADQDTAYVAGYEGDVGVLVAVDLATGARRWSVPAQAAALQGPVAGAGGVALIDGSSVVHGFDRATGTTRWSAVLDGGPGGMPIVLGNAVVVGTKGDSEVLDPPNHRVVAFAADDGTFLGGRELVGNDFGVAGFGRLGDLAFAPSFDLGLVAELLSLETS